MLKMQFLKMVYSLESNVLADLGRVCLTYLKVQISILKEIKACLRKVQTNIQISPLFLFGVSCWLRGVRELLAAAGSLAAATCRFRTGTNQPEDLGGNKLERL